MLFLMFIPNKAKMQSSKVNTPPKVTHRSNRKKAIELLVDTLKKSTLNIAKHLLILVGTRF